MPNQRSQTIQVRVEPKIQEALRAMAHDDNRSLSGFIRFHLTKLVQGSVKESPVVKPVPDKEKRSKTPREEEAQNIILETSKRKFVLNP